MDTEKLVENKLLTIGARISMVVATTLILPIVGVLLIQIWNAAANIATKVDNQAVQIRLLEQSVKFGFEANKTDIQLVRNQLIDHEGRLRVIESDRRAAPR